MSDEDVREQVRKLIVTGDNRLKQGHDARVLVKARETFERALALAEHHGIADERLREIVGRRIDDSHARERAAQGGS